MNLPSPKVVIGSFTLLLAITFGTLDGIAPAGRRLAKVAGLDPVNYFGISHSLLFDHDYNLNNEFTRVKPDGMLWAATRPETGLPGSPWGIGYSVLEMPFLAAGTLMDAIAGNPADGYSKFAITAYAYGNVVMTGLGLMAFFTLLYRAGPFLGLDEHQTRLYGLLVTFAVFFGTNVGYYTFSQLSHASSFWFASMFLMQWWKIRFTNGLRGWLILGLIGGFLSICRWQDLIYLGGPILFDLLGPEIRDEPLAWLKSRMLYGLGVVVCWVPQIAQWKIIYGKYLTVPQGPNFLEFPPAFMWDVVMSSRNGWFLWTPLVLLGVAGLCYGAIKATRTFAPWIVVIILEVAAVGSMKTWHGFDSFSARYMLSTIPLVGLGLFTLVAKSATGLRRSVMATTVACCIFTLLFAVQFRLDLIPKNETLTVAELVTDKLRLPQVRTRKLAANQARRLLQEGNVTSAIQTLEGVTALGEDRDVLQVLAKAYKAGGRDADADNAALRLKKLLDSRI